jgi:hypothetical protein
MIATSSLTWRCWPVELASPFPVGSLEPKTSTILTAGLMPDTSYHDEEDE